MPEKAGMRELKAIGAAVRRNRQLRELTLEDIAKSSSKLDIGNLSRLERGLQGFSLEVLGAVCDALSISLGELFRQAFEAKDKGLAQRPKVGLCAYVPVLALDEVRSARELPSRLEGYDPIATTAKVGPRSFAFVVGDDSMLPEFPKGIAVVVDPQERPKHGSYVVALSDDKTVFRQYLVQGGRRYLRPLGWQMPLVELSKHDAIIGAAKQRLSFLNQAQE
jgi:transcriptional regulator with XRE-family HTH domain